MSLKMKLHVFGKDVAAEAAPYLPGFGLSRGRTNGETSLFVVFTMPTGPCVGPRRTSQSSSLQVISSLCLSLSLRSLLCGFKPNQTYACLTKRHEERRLECIRPETKPGSGKMYDMRSCVVVLQYDIEGSLRTEDDEITPSLEKKPPKSIKWNSFGNFTPLLSAGIDNTVAHIVTGSCYYTSFSFAIRIMFFCYVVRCTAEDIAVWLCFLQACKKDTWSSVSWNDVTDEGYYSFDCKIISALRMDTS